MAILIERENWMNSQLSLARFYGSIKINDTEYYVVPPMDDLVDVDFIKYFQKLGRDVFIGILQTLKDKPKPYIKGYLDVELQHRHVKRKKVEPIQLSLF